MRNFDPKKLNLVGCDLVQQEMTTPLLTYINPGSRNGELTFKRALRINEEQSVIMLFLFLSLNINDDEGDRMALCNSTYRCMFSYEELTELYELPAEGEDDEESSEKKLEFGAAATLHSVAYSTVRGMFMMHLSSTPFSNAIMPIHTINELLSAELIEVE